MVKLESMSDAEILILAKQEQIIAKLDYIIKQSGFSYFEGHTDRVEGITHGYGIPDMGFNREEWLDETQKDECALILDIFWSLYLLAEKQNAPKGFSKLIAFLGFDLNDATEAAYYFYAQWIIGQDRYESLSPLPRSHTPMLADYRKLIEQLDTAGYIKIVGDIRIFNFPADPAQATFNELTKILQDD